MSGEKSDGSDSMAAGTHPLANRKSRKPLPRHIEEMLDGQFENGHSIKLNYQAEGLMDNRSLENRLNQLVRSLPWDPKKRSKQTYVSGSSTGRPTPRRTLERQSQTPTTKKDYTKFESMISNNPYNKIGFVGLCPRSMDEVPVWVKARLETACQSARFELPANKKLLEDMTPMQYLAKYTRLYREQFRRYAKLFKKYKQEEHSLEYKNLHQALNSLYANRLSLENFEILCTGLFIDTATKMDKETFIGVCTFADRLYWTAFLGHMEKDTFTTLAPNRKVLEMGDFEFLMRKLHGLNISREMHALLRSLS